MRALVGWSCSFAALFVFWLLVVGTLTREEIIAGLIAAAIGAAAGQVAHVVGLPRVRIEWRHVRALSRALLRVVPEFGELMWSLLTRRGGVFRTIEYPVGGERRVDAGRRALIGYAASLSPGRVVIDVDQSEGTVLVHDFGGSGSSELP
jgi:multisubunit Na+/H+ antiporter MnhE subunit